MNPPEHPTIEDFVQLSNRVASIEANHREILELIQLLHDVRAALKVFVTLGNAFKWIVGIGASIGGLFWFLHHTPGSGS